MKSWHPDFKVIVLVIVAKLPYIYIYTYTLFYEISKSGNSILETNNVGDTEFLS